MKFFKFILLKCAFYFKLQRKNNVKSVSNLGQIPASRQQCQPRKQQNQKAFPAKPPHSSHYAWGRHEQKGENSSLYAKNHSQKIPLALNSKRKFTQILEFSPFKNQNSSQTSQNSRTKIYKGWILTLLPWIFTPRNPKFSYANQISHSDAEFSHTTN